MAMWIVAARFTSWCVVALLSVGILSGCGGSSATPQLGEVRGTVTLDGAPLPGANLMFQPAIGGASHGKTDESGQYTLYYGSSSEKGATPGEHTVRINCYGGENDTTDRVPEKYNTSTTLTAQVSPEDNQINFDLKSK